MPSDCKSLSLDLENFRFCNYSGNGLVLSPSHVGGLIDSLSVCEGLHSGNVFLLEDLPLRFSAIEGTNCE